MERQNNGDPVQVMKLCCMMDFTMQSPHKTLKQTSMLHYKLISNVTHQFNLVNSRTRENSNFMVQNNFVYFGGGRFSASQVLEQCFFFQLFCLPHYSPLIYLSFFARS